MDFRSFLKNNLVCLDGGMGTLLQAEGLQPGEAPERWNLTRPDVIRRIHTAYFDAGSHVVNTNTFGANRLHFPSDELERIIASAVKNADDARAFSASAHEKFIALDIGPTGRLLKPYGDLDFDEAVDVFAEVVRIGVGCGVDLITVETMNDSYETKAALLAVKENCDLPVIVTNAYGADGKLMTGATPEAMVALLEGMRADAIGVNCSLGPKQLAPIVGTYLENASVPVVVKPNAGLPVIADGKTCYDVSPEEFVECVRSMAEQGARVVGGCCGTTPDYIRLLSEAVRTLTPKPIMPCEKTVICSYTHAVSFGDVPLLIGERINPTGKKRFRQALCEHDIPYILKEGLSQAECGVDVLDVNVGIPDIDESALLAEVICELQEVTDLPLQPDTASPTAMERALRYYNGKALINSVNGKKESMDAVFPLVRRYGGVVVALTLDEDSIPDTADGRIAIARRILKTAADYGISKKDIVFDPLTMTVSADAKAALITLETVRRIRNELGCHVSLGVSNVSFGLPKRDILTGHFFTAALENGLSAAILNPYSRDMMKAYHAFRALHGTDENCMGYISFCETLGDEQSSPSGVTPAAKSEDASLSGISPLQSAIRKGLRSDARSLTDSLLKTMPPLTLIAEEIIPALDAVGKGFEAKTVFLPQLLMSAEAAQSAFEVIKTAFPAAQDTESGTVVVLATVKGDIHDIGKNIVRLLLENYGFAVHDLGKDVAPEKVLAEVLRCEAPLAGLSALMTTTVPAMEETIRLLHEKAPFCRVIVGGAVLNEEYAARIHADCYAKDAMETVRYAMNYKK